MHKFLMTILIFFCFFVFGCQTPSNKEIFVPAKRAQHSVKKIDLPFEIPELKPINKPLKPNKSQIKKIEKFKPIEEQRLEQKKHYKPKEVIEQLRLISKQTPTIGGSINAISLYPYIEGALYDIYTSPFHVTNIMLQPGESLTMPIVIGDSVRWQVAESYSGKGDKKRVHIFLKPFYQGLKTNLVIATDKHVYHFEIKSFKETYQSAVSFTYPVDEFEQLQKQIEEDSKVTHSVEVQNLNFNYSIKGKASFKPLSVFDDRKKTYIQFPDSINYEDLPPLFILSHNKKGELVNYRYLIDINSYVVDRLFSKAFLQIGNKRSQRVYIINNSK